LNASDDSTQFRVSPDKNDNALASENSTNDKIVSRFIQIYFLASFDKDFKIFFQMDTTTIRINKFWYGANHAQYYLITHHARINTPILNADWFLSTDHFNGNYQHVADPLDNSKIIIILAVTDLLFWSTTQILCLY